MYPLGGGRGVYSKLKAYRGGSRISGNGFRRWRGFALLILVHFSSKSYEIEIIWSIFIGHCLGGCWGGGLLVDKPGISRR